MIIEQPEEITLCTLECIVMPSGEVLVLGKTIGWYEELRKYLDKVS